VGGSGLASNHEVLTSGLIGLWWNSGFQNTDLDLQLRQRDITAIVFGGMEAQTCLEGTARASFELGYHITIL
jgi:nicotinamidase-related amidase